jgi:hypothetical protein
MSTAGIRITDLLRMLKLLENVTNMKGLKNMYDISVGNIKERLSHGREDNIEMALTEINKGVDLQQILQDRLQ